VPPPNLTLRAPAKVNLFLAVLERLPDGYHRVETVLQAVSLWDEVRLERTPQGISIACDDPSIPTGEDNLCHRAAALMAQRLPQRVRPLGIAIALRKRIPAQAGLGGGSSDAAATLIGLNRLWRLGLRRRDLLEVAAELGADVPFFVHGGLALATGRGDNISRLKSGPALHMVLCRSGSGVSTAWAYSRCRPCGGEATYRVMLDALDTGAAAAVAAAVRNDLEAAVLPQRRDIAELKERLLGRGAVGALMAGSGSAVVGIFPARKTAQETAAHLSNNRVWACAVRSVGGGVRFAS